MIKVGIMLNEVLRNYIEQLLYVYGKYIDNPTFEASDIQSLDDLEKLLPLNRGGSNIYDFIYKEAPLEILGHATAVENFNISNLNNVAMDMEDNEEGRFYIISRELGSAIPATLFFLSKIGCKIKNIRFDSDIDNLLENIDVIITADPKVLNSDLVGKIKIKIETNYNKNCDSDYSFNSLSELLNSDDLYNIINTKNITYKEIKAV